ncbi:MAG: Crp/Fnr family transcriptional regulator [Bryobacteraceae bacterium]
MAVGAMTGNSRIVREDPLSYLPRKGLIEYRRNQIIFDQDQPSDGLHLVVQGRVKVSAAVDDGSLTVIDIYTADEFFGESGLLGLVTRGQTATALETTTLMSWTTAEVEYQIERQPKLGTALVQMMVQRCLEFEERLQSFALEKTTERVARSLLRFAERLGMRQDDGSMRIPPLTHQVLSEYVGTSREIVTFQMNHLRQQGYVNYSRKGISIQAGALREYLQKEVGTTVP